MESKKQAVHTLRSLLRTIKKRVPHDRPNPMSDYILKTYRMHENVTDRNEMKALRGQARDLLFMWTSVDEQKRIWKLDEGVEKKLSGQELGNSLFIIISNFKKWPHFQMTFQNILYINLIPFLST